MKKYLLLLILLTGCVSAKTVENGSVVNVQYTGELVNGTVFDSGNITFTAGSGQVIKGFDDGVIGMKTGEKKTLTIPPKDAYGEYSPIPLTAPFDTVNKSVFNAIGKNAYVGVGVIALLNDGTRIPMIVTSIENGTVTMVEDKKHPLQGETLVFKIKILSIN